MKKALININRELYYYIDGVEIAGVHDDIYGDITDIYGDVTDISGDVSGISGDITNIYGYVSGISGNVSGISGDIDDCELTEQDRENGVDIKDLVNL